jgi:hypothetical protein
MEVEKEESVAVEQVLQTAQKFYQNGNFEGVMECLAVAEKTYRKVFPVFSVC